MPLTTCSTSLPSGSTSTARRTASAAPGPGGDFQVVPPDRLGPEPEVDGADLARLQLDRRLGGARAAEPGGLAEREGDRLGAVQVVRDDDGHGDLVAPGERRREVEVDEERLEDPERRLGRRRAGRRPPRRWR